MPPGEESQGEDEEDKDSGGEEVPERVIDVDNWLEKDGDVDDADGWVGVEEDEGNDVGTEWLICQSVSYQRRQIEPGRMKSKARSVVDDHQ